MGGGDAWGTSDIERFVNVSSGALGIALAQFPPGDSKQVPCYLSVARILPQRAFFMLLPAVVIGLVALALLWLYVSGYEATGISKSIGATVTDILVNDRTLVVGDALKTDENLGSSRASTRK